VESKNVEIKMWGQPPSAVRRAQLDQSAIT